ncbi:helix-turn-helix domain-containing protein (plasmid) [Klebsiella pneumoniae]|nr:helix-turn-helix domain-containing protein [Klebsiella pneumoniae]
MLIQKAYKYRLNPTDAQAQRLRQMCGCARFVWNYAWQRRSVFLRPDENSFRL